jgi:hypothetical protein
MLSEGQILSACLDDLAGAISNGKRLRRRPASARHGGDGVGGSRCATPQIAAITGRSLKTVTRILDKYLTCARVLAGGAVTLFENAKADKL